MTDRTIVSRLRRAAEHPHKGERDTDSTMLLGAAARLSTGQPVGGQWTTRTVVRVLREVAHIIDNGQAPPCADHNPVQHRDARPPWCNTCGLTAGGAAPVGRLDRGSQSDQLRTRLDQITKLHQEANWYATEDSCADLEDETHTTRAHFETSTGDWVCADLLITTFCAACTPENADCADDLVVWPCDTVAIATGITGGAA